VLPVQTKRIVFVRRADSGVSLFTASEYRKGGASGQTSASRER
jgi:hypothetical protein